MEPNSPADDPSPETPPAETAEAAPEPHDETPSAEFAGDDFPPDENEPAPVDGDVAADELTHLAEASQRARLAPADEERMTALLKEALLGGRAGVARAIDALPKVPWIVGVRAIEQVWPELTAGFRTQLLAGLGKDETDAARRMRLSVARALFKIDAPVTLKVAVSVAKEMRDKDSGGLAPKHAQIFSNVFIGRAKPWLAQLALADLKPAEADVLVGCAVLAVFTLPHPPVTQLGILKWARENDRLDKLNEASLDAVKKGVARWSAKWQGALRREVDGLPEEIANALKPAAAEAGAGDGEPREISPESNDADADERADRDDADEDEREENEVAEEGAEPVRKERPVYEPRPQKPIAAQESRREREPRERPVYEPRNAGAGGSRFNLGDALRQIDQHVQSLRNDLAAAQAKLRQKDERPRRAEKIGPIIEGEPTPEELARLNQQLEARNAELQARIDDLTQHSEDVAASMGAHSGDPVNDGGAQLRTLLALKLQEDFADFMALEKESNDLVIPQHYKGLLQHVFEVLRQLEVPLKTE